MQRVWIAIAVFGWFGVSAQADDELAATVRRWVRQLDAPQLVEREKAEAELLKLGPAAVEFLPKVTERTPAEVALRVGRIRQKLERAAADSVARASTVTLNAVEWPLSKILASITEQTGNPIVDYRAKFGHPTTDPALTISLKDAGFWQAFDRVLDDAELTVYPYAKAQGICIVRRGPDQALRAESACYAGPFRVEATSVTAARDLRVPASRSLRVVQEIAWEPKLRPFYFVQRMADVQATDERGRPIAVENLSAAPEVPVLPDQTATTFELALAPPSRDVQQIASLRGKISTLVPGRLETFRFGPVDKPKNVEKRIAAATVTMERAGRFDGVWEVNVRVRFDQPGRSLESHRGWYSLVDAYLEDQDGKPVRQTASEMTRQAENEFGFAYRFTKLEGAPRGFTIRVPGSMVETSFNYELKYIRLP